jgi:peptide/nickel transport system substrate-binding protein
MSRPDAPRWEALARAAAVLLLPALAAQSGCARSTPVAGDRPIEVLVSSDPETLDPRHVTDAVGMRATRLVHAGLVRLDADTLEPRPYAARGWRWLDGSTLEVSLRDDVRFHSGAPFGARDVVATLRAFASPAVGSRHAGVVDAIASAEAEDERTVVIRLSRPHATLLTDLELPILRADQAAAPPAPDGSLDGLGPYAVVHSGGGEVLLTPAEGSVLPRPRHAVVLRTVHDENARALRLEAGRADVAVNLISPTLLPALLAQPGLSSTRRPGANLTYMIVQESHGPLGDARVRAALSLALDRAMICSTLLGGRAEPAGGLMAPAHWAHADGPPLPHDAARARRELQDAGAEGMRVALLTSTERLRGDVARVLAQELAEVGVRADVITLEIGTMIARLNAGDFDLAILQLPEMTEPNVLRYFLHSNAIPPRGANRGRVRDARLDALLDEGDRVMDITARRAVYARLEALEREEMHVLPLWYEDQVSVTSDRARVFSPSAEGRWLALASIP